MIRTLVIATCAVLAVQVCRAADDQLERAKLELLVEQAGELYQEAARKGSATHTAAHQYLFGMMYSSGTNLLARKDTQATARLRTRYMDLAKKNYEAYTKVENATDMASATGSNHGKSGARHRAKRLANAEKLRDKELKTAIGQWEAFVSQLKKTR